MGEFVRRRCFLEDAAGSRVAVSLLLVDGALARRGWMCGSFYNCETTARQLMVAVRLKRDQKRFTGNLFVVAGAGVT
jgi:hypothetical protein